MRSSIPLCVDLDGTLLKTDVMWEGILVILHYRRRYLWQLPWWLLQGKSYLKAKVSAVAPLKPEVLPYRAEVLTYIKQAREQARSIVLVTAAHHRIATAVAAYLQLFDEVIASDDT